MPSPYTRNGKIGFNLTAILSSAFFAEKVDFHLVVLADVSSTYYPDRE